MKTPMNKHGFLPDYAVLVITIMLLLLTACTPIRQTSQDAMVEDTFAILATATPLPLHEAEALAADALWYADRFNVTQEEALLRLERQKTIGELNARLSEQEQETFAGLWIENEPQYKVMIAFTEQDEESIQPYIQGQPYEEYVELRTYRYSLAELENIQDQGLAIANQLDVSASSDIDVAKNRVTLVVGNPELFLKEMQAAGIILPEPIELSAIDPANPSDTNRGGIFTYTLPDGRLAYFPQQPPALVYPEGEFAGTLALDEMGCLRLEDWETPAPLILWRHDLSLRIVDNKIEVLNDAGELMMQVGEPVKIGGGLSDTVHIAGMPLAACPGPYLQLGEIDIID